MNDNSFKDNSMTRLGLDNSRSGDHRDENIFYALSKKTERIAMALYMVLDFIDDSEPLKMSMKKSIVDMLSDMCSVIDMSVNVRTPVLVRTLSHTESLLSGMLILRRVGIVSEMNADILLEEFISMRDILEGEIKKVYHFRPFASARSFSSEHVSLPDDLFANIERGKTEEDSPSLSVKAKSMYSGMQKVSNVIKDKLKLKDKSESQNNSRMSIKKAKDVLYERQRLLLAFIGMKHIVSAKDVSDSFPNFNSKTIQRDLVTLVNQGRLLKQGDRRWSTYTFIPES